MRKSVYWLLLVAFLFIITACNDGGGEPTEAEAAALAFAEAVLVNDEPYLSANTCVNVPAGSTSLDMYAFFTIGMAIKNSPLHTGADLEIELDASTESEEENEAMIRIEGDAKFPANLPASEYAPLPVDQTARIDEVWRMSLEDGIWKWCGGTENQN